MFDPRNHAPAPAELAGRVIAITGASSGIGRAIALACAAHQAQVVLIGRNAARLEAVHAEIAAGGAPEATIAVLDLEKALARDYDAVADAVLERYGRLDGLLHNAGLLGTLTPIEHYDVPTWCRVLHVNVTAAFALTQVLLPALKKSADASVVFTASAVGRRGRAYWGAYAVSKFAVEGLSQVLAAGTRGHQPRARQHAQPRPHPHRDASPGLPGRGHRHPAAAGGACRRLHRAARTGERRRHRPGLRRPALLRAAQGGSRARNARTCRL